MTTATRQQRINTIVLEFEDQPAREWTYRVIIGAHAVIVHAIDSAQAERRARAAYRKALNMPADAYLVRTK